MSNTDQNYYYGSMSMAECPDCGSELAMTLANLHTDIAGINRGCCFSCPVCKVLVEITDVEQELYVRLEVSPTVMTLGLNHDEAAMMLGILSRARNAYEGEGKTDEADLAERTYGKLESLLDTAIKEKKRIRRTKNAGPSA